MRKQYNDILKALFYTHLISTRDLLQCTQAQMAKNLLMDVRSYIELDHGNSCCSALTLMLYLLYYCENPQKFLNNLRDALNQEGILSLITIRPEE